MRVESVFFAKFEDLTGEDQEKVIDRTRQEMDLYFEAEYFQEEDCWLHIPEKYGMEIDISEGVDYDYSYATCAFVATPTDDCISKVLDAIASKLSPRQVRFLRHIIENWGYCVSFGIDKSLGYRSHAVICAEYDETETPSYYYDQEKYHAENVAALDALVSALEDLAQDVINEVMSTIKKSFDYWEGDEYIKESIIANDIEFEVDSEGNLI